jgi:hypothetical protein
MENQAQQNQNGFWDDAEVISSYTRAQAIEDGVLADLSTLFPSDTRLYKYPVACTSAVWNLIETAAKKDTSNAAAIVWDICYMSAKFPVAKIDESTMLFKVIIGRKTHTLKVNCGPGDNAEPVITIMLRNED